MQELLSSLKTDAHRCYSQLFYFVKRQHYAKTIIIANEFLVFSSLDFSTEFFGFILLNRVLCSHPKLILTLIVFTPPIVQCVFLQLIAFPGLFSTTFCLLLLCD